MDDKDESTPSLNSYGKPYPTKRIHYPVTLASQFLADCREVCQHFAHDKRVIILDHLRTVLKLMERDLAENFANTEAVYEEFYEMEKQLADTFRKEHVHYNEKQFYQYFDYSIVLTEKDIVPIEILDNVPLAVPGLNNAEIEVFLLLAESLVAQERLNVYLTPVDQEPPPDGSISGEEENDRNLTRARQLLAMHYLFRSIPRNEKKSTTAAEVRFLHLLLGIKFSKLQNSGIYKKYAAMPSYKSGELLLDDLKLIKPYFEELGLSQAVKMIEADIEKAVDSLPSYIRKRYLQ